MTAAEEQGAGIEVQAAALHAGYLGQIAQMVIDRDGTEVSGPLRAIEVQYDRSVNSRTGFHVHLTVGSVRSDMHADDVVIFPELSATPAVPQIPTR
jgi:hypothetical protein